MKFKKPEVIAVLLSASLAVQPVTVLAAATAESAVQSANEKTEDAAEIQNVTVQKTEPVTVSGQVRNGMVQYADQTGMVTAGQKKVTLGLGEMQKLSFSGVDNLHDVSFESNKPSVVQVDVDGNVYAIMAGSATITAWYNGKKAKTKVKVPVKKENGAINVVETYTGNGTKEKKVKVKGVKKNAVTVSEADFSYEGKDSDDNTFSVNKKIMTVTTSYGTVSYDKYAENPTAVNTSVTIGVGETKTLITSGISEGIIWKAKKKKIAQVDSLGRVTGIKAGTAKIIAKVGKKKLTFNVTVDAAKTPDADPDEVANQVRLNRFTSVNLSPGGRILAIVKTDSYKDEPKADTHSGTYEEGYFTYRFNYDSNGSTSSEITGLTETGAKQTFLSVPAVIGGQTVKKIDSYFNVNDVYFDLALAVSAIPADISQKIYTNGDFTYLYKVQNDELVVEIRGLSEQGKAKDKIVFPAKINDRRVVLISDAAYEECNGKDIDMDESLADQPLTDTISDYEYLKDDFIYSFDVSGNTYITIIKDLSDKGKEKDTIIVPGTINGHEVTEIRDQMLENAEGKNLTLDPIIKADALPDTVSDHIYVSADGWKYRYKVVDDEIVVEIVGMTDKIKNSDNITIPGTINGKKVEKVDISIFRDLEGKHITLADDLDDKAVPDNATNYEFVDGYIKYKYVKDDDGKITVILTGLTEEGKKQPKIHIPSKEGGRDVSGLSDEFLRDIEGKEIEFDDDFPSDILPPSFFEKEYVSEPFTYRYVKADDGTLQSRITGLSDKGEKAASITVSGNVAGLHVSVIDDNMFKEAEGKELILTDEINGNMVPSTISDHQYVSGDFTYHFVVDEETGKIYAVIDGLSEEGKKKDAITIPTTIGGKDVISVTYEALQDMRGKTVTVPDPDVIPDEEYSEGDFSYRYVVDDQGHLKTEITGLSEEGKKTISEGGKVKIPEEIGGQEVIKITEGLFEDIQEIIDDPNGPFKDKTPKPTPDDFVEPSDNPEVVYELYDVDVRILEPDENGVRTAEIIGMKRLSDKSGDEVTIPADKTFFGCEVSSVTKKAVNSIGDKKILMDPQYKDVLPETTFSVGDFTWEFMVNDEGQVGAYITGLSREGKAHAHEDKLKLPSKIENLPVLAVSDIVLEYLESVPTTADLRSEYFVYRINDNGDAEIIGILENHPDFIEIPETLGSADVVLITTDALKQSGGCDLSTENEGILPSGTFTSDDYDYKYILMENEDGLPVIRIELTDLSEAAKARGGVADPKEVGDILNGVKIGKIDGKAKVFNISYDLNDNEKGSQARAALKDAPASYTGASPDITIPEPTRSGYIFKGWKADGSADVKTSYVIPTGSEGDVKLTAQWEADDSTVQVMYIVPELVATGRNGDHTEYELGNYEEYSDYDAKDQHASGDFSTVEGSKVVTEITGKTAEKMKIQAPELEGFSLRQTRVIDDTEEKKEAVMLASNATVSLSSAEGAKDSTNNSATLTLKPESKNKVVVFVYSRTQYDVNLDLDNGSWSGSDSYGFEGSGTEYKRTEYYGATVDLP